MVACHSWFSNRIIVFLFFCDWLRASIDESTTPHKHITHHQLSVRRWVVEVTVTRKYVLHIWPGPSRCNSLCSRHASSAFLLIPSFWPFPCAARSFVTHRNTQCTVTNDREYPSTYSSGASPSCTLYNYYTKTHHRIVYNQELIKILVSAVAVTIVVCWCSSLSHTHQIALSVALQFQIRIFRIERNREKIKRSCVRERWCEESAWDNTGVICDPRLDNNRSETE